MASLDMDGPFDLTADEIMRVIREPRPGNFAIGHLDENKRFAVQYVGRDDASVFRGLVAALQKRVGQPGAMARLFQKKHMATVFKFSYASTTEAAYEKHCRNFHGFNASGQLENKAHPSPPPGSDLTCPICRSAG